MVKHFCYVVKTCQLCQTCGAIKLLVVIKCLCHMLTMEDLKSTCLVSSRVKQSFQIQAQKCGCDKEVLATKYY